MGGSHVVEQAGPNQRRTCFRGMHGHCLKRTRYLDTEPQRECWPLVDEEHRSKARQFIVERDAVINVMAAKRRNLEKRVTSFAELIQCQVVEQVVYVPVATPLRWTPRSVRRRARATPPAWKSVLRLVFVPPCSGSTRVLLNSRTAWPRSQRCVRMIRRSHYLLGLGSLTLFDRRRACSGRGHLPPVWSSSCSGM